jgi:hypothetical protein
LKQNTLASCTSELSWSKSLIAEPLAGAAIEIQLAETLIPAAATSVRKILRVSIATASYLRLVEFPHNHGGAASAD